MNLSKTIVIKNFLLFFLFSFIFSSCEPEAIPIDDSNNKSSGKLYLDTGNQENPPETKG